METGWTVIFGLEFEFSWFFSSNRTNWSGLPEPNGGGFIRPVGKKTLAATTTDEEKKIQTNMKKTRRDKFEKIYFTNFVLR